MVIRHNQGSKVDAVNVIVSILLPASVKFGALSTTNNTAFSSKLQHANQAEFKVEIFAMGVMPVALSLTCGVSRRLFILSLIQCVYCFSELEINCAIYCQLLREKVLLHN